MRIRITLLFLLITNLSIGQKKYVMLDRAYNKPALYTDSITKENIKIGYYPIFANQLDSLLEIVSTFRKLGKQGLSRTYFNNEDYKTSSINLQISNSHHAYGDVYDIDIISITQQGEYRLKLSDASQSSHFTDSYIRNFYDYIKRTIKTRNKSK
ncbi:MAG: hypothetical protein ABL929_06480 [Ferruginibacter sp.]